MTGIPSDGPLPHGLRNVLAARLGLSMPSISDERLDRTLASAQSALAESDEAETLAALGWKPLDCDAWQDVVDAVTIHETHFMRQKGWFDEFERQVLVPLIDERSLRGPREIRIWSAGCASGEEPYTLAMMLDRLLPDRRRWTIEILGTDISAATLAAARAATYRKWALRELGPAERKAHFAEVAPGRYQLSDAIREMVDFKLLNLADPALAAWPAPGRFDIIFCRNVLIYWTPDVQRSVATALGQRLAPGGWLVVSPAEAVAEWYRPLRPSNFPNAIFFRNAPAAAKAAAPPPVVERSPLRATRAAEPAQAGQPKSPRPTPLPPQARQSPPASSSAPVAEAVARAQAFADQGRLQEARAASEAILADDTLNGDAYLLLASVCEELGDVPAAFEAGRRAVYLSPDSAVAHFRLGALHSAMGQAPQARRSFMTVLDLLQWQPDDALAAQHADLTVGVLRYAANSYLADAGGARAVNDHG